MPPSRKDRQLLVATFSFLIVAFVFAIGVIWVVSSRSSGPADSKKPFFIGLRKGLTESITENSPLYFANPTAGDGFWLDVEDGALVALVLDRPGTKDCVVKWKEQRDAYVDCNDDELQSTELDRYKLTIGSRNGSPKSSVYVDLRQTFPAPDTSSE